MVHVYKDILYASIKDVAQCDCYLDLYLPDRVNSTVINSKLQQFSDKTKIKDERIAEYGRQDDNDNDELKYLQFDVVEKEQNGNGSATQGLQGEDKSKGDGLTGLPLVLFFHGGGWRRGGRAAWKHYLYFDVNFIVSFLQYFVGTYDNIGRTLASNNIPCAVVSYPLTEACWYILLAEMFLSYIQCCVFVLILCLPIFGIVFIIRFMVNNVSVSTLSIFVKDVLDAVDVHDLDTVNIVATIILWTALLTNLITGVLFVLRRKEFGFRIAQTLLYSAATAAFSSLAMVSDSPVSNLAILTLVLNQGMIFAIRYRRSGSSYEEQVKAVAEAVRWAKEFSRNVHLTDSRKLFLMGHSAGGHLATLSALDETILSSVSCSIKDLKGIISLSGVYDLLCLNKPFLRPAYLRPTFGDDLTAWKGASPEHRAKDIQDSNFSPKFLLLCAEKDLFLKPQSYKFSRTLDDLNLECRHVEIPGCNHFTIITDCRTIKGSPLSYVLDFINSG